MKAVIGLVVGICALCILAFNPQLVSGVFNMAFTQPVEQWKKNPNNVKGATDILIDAPKFPDREGGAPTDKYMRSDEEGGVGGSSSGGKVYGGRAVAVQRAKGL